MFLRTVFCIGLAILVMPTDEKSQAKLLQQAQSTLHWTWTFCDRNEATCKAGAEAWATFVKKAEFGVALASGMVKQWAEKSATESEAGHAPIAPAVAPSQPPVQQPVHKLKREDTLPPWRGPGTGKTGA